MFNLFLIVFHLPLPFSIMKSSVVVSLLSPSASIHGETSHVKLIEWELYVLRLIHIDDKNACLYDEKVGQKIN